MFLLSCLAYKDVSLANPTFPTPETFESYFFPITFSKYRY